MRISATSALVLNWTDPSVWTTDRARAYFSKLDLSEGDVMKRQFGAGDHAIQRETITNRKHFMRNEAVTFLEAQARAGRHGQVLILAAGLAPLSVELGVLFPKARIFDVDKYGMTEKKALVNDPSLPVQYIDCDITDHAAMSAKLKACGFDTRQPALAVLEGIIYYLTIDEMAGLLHHLHDERIAVAGDFCLDEASVDEKTRPYLVRVFDIITRAIGMTDVRLYSEVSLRTLLAGAGYDRIRFHNMRDIQRDRSGGTGPFPASDSAWIRLYAAEGMD